MACDYIANSMEKILCRNLKKGFPTISRIQIPLETLLALLLSAGVTMQLSVFLSVIPSDTSTTIKRSVWKHTNAKVVSGMTIVQATVFSPPTESQPSSKTLALATCIAATMDSV